jgi:hypothetical protein
MSIGNARLANILAQGNQIEGGCRHRRGGATAWSGGLRTVQLASIKRRKGKAAKLPPGHRSGYRP